jgi:hypothetical protein
MRDPKDRLIAALAAQLRAERETRETLAFVVANGQLDPATLAAVLADPVPVVTAEDLAVAERFVAREGERRAAPRPSRRAA